ncbi:hypothetical protein HanXRQr2_Chr11g0468151 [Helianthus annuus]|uniref:Uncharacterized protein n=1 Tax=Helianthus annuus TaxID=4232 RepID=A0A251T789_HELAN|nr:hypothetical protein HanXRQr2_Chr11g0468151 [Helianthus annuus]KAJ0873363.1 hypothetical protein HanPSC8_Chr11g0451771 [Helianthus annuus]
MKCTGVMFFLAVLFTFVLISSQGRNIQTSKRPQVVNDQPPVLTEGRHLTTTDTKRPSLAVKKGGYGCWKCWNKHRNRRL